MRRRYPFLPVLVVVLLAAFSLAGQSTATADKSATTKSTATTKAGVLPKTPWGDPDLQGVWFVTQDVPLERGPWFRLMWLSNRDFCHLMERCIEAEKLPPFVILNGMSANAGMRWDIGTTRKLVGYAPQDDVTRPAIATSDAGH